jgi:hypothetical protein
MAGSRIPQTEYSTWVVQDKHAKATEVLANPVSVRMARILGLPRADTAPKCLACHSLDVSADQRARTFTANEGVSCEACHGPASAWLGPHTTRGWTHAQSVQLGMYDTKDVAKRTERCLTCHLGTAEKFVDHEMIAAGHPDLVFDLDAFSAAMPRHCQEDRSDTPAVMRTWGTGQLVHLREGLQRLATRARGQTWPEYGELDCFSCHHSLTRAEDSWRQALGYAGRRPGNPPWNPSRIAISRHLMRLIDSSAAQQIEGEVAKVAAAATRLNADRNEVATMATRTADLVDGLARRASSFAFDRAAAQRMLRAIIQDADDIAAQGERAAEQAAMSVDSLYGMISPGAGGEGRTIISGLFQQLENPSAYDPRRFAAQLKRLQPLLGS